MKESQIQKKILRYLKEHHIYHFKVIVANRKGIPDIIMCYKGTFVGLEVKRPGGQPTELQKINMRDIKASGGEARVVTCVEEVIDIIQILDMEFGVIGSIKTIGEKDDTQIHERTPSGCNR